MAVMANYQSSKTFDWLISSVFLVKVSSAEYHKVSIGSGKGLMQSDNKPLPEAMLIKLYDSAWYIQWLMR